MKNNAAVPPERRLIDLWLGLRIFTLIAACLLSGVRPLTEREQSIPLWPPTSPYSTWFERAVAAPWERWDAKLYVEIVKTGHRTDNGTAQFHPLLPLLAKPFFLAPAAGLLAVSSVASLLFVVVFYRLARLDVANPETATRLMLAFPVSFILFAPYTEGLWLLLAAWSFWRARQGRWWESGIAGALATLTRQQGIFLLPPLAYEIWSRGERRWQPWAAIALIPAALAGWVAYRGVFLSDVHPDFSSVNALLYTTILAPSSVKVVETQAMLPPWEAMGRAIGITWQSGGRDNVLNLILGAWMCLLAALAWPRLRTSYRILTVLLFAAGFAYHTGPDKPYMGLGRHLLLAFPVFIGSAPPLERWKQPVAALSMFGMLSLTLFYVFEAWVP